MKKNYKKGLALSLAMSVTATGIPAYAAESNTILNEDGSSTTVITVTEEISDKKEDGTIVEGTIVNVNTETKNAEGELTSTSWSEEGEISETNEKEYDSENDDVTVDLIEESEVTETGSVNESTTKTEYDSELGADVTTTVTETPREVTTTTDKVDVTYDNEVDAYEGEEDLEFMTPVWDGTQLNLGGGTFDWFPSSALQQMVEGYDYTPYGFMHNDVTHMLYIKTDKDGNMVDTDGNEVYYYDEATCTYSRNLPDEIDIYDIAYKKGLLCYKKATEDGSEYFENVTDEASVDKIVNVANSMMCAFYDKSQTHSDELWDAVYDDLLRAGKLLEESSNNKANSIFKKIKENYPKFLTILDISRLAEDYNDDGQVTQETTYIYNALFELLAKERSNYTFVAPENMIPAYCVDVNTGTVRGSWYDLMNLEDVGYYSTERTAENGYISDADRIKAIAANGYWGTKEGKGSLEYMKAFFQKRLDAAIAAGETLPYTQKDIDGLTHGCALSITQHSLWRFGNSLDGAYMDAYTYAYKNISERNARIERFIEYFTTMPIDTSEFDESEIFTQEKYVDSMNVTIGDRVAGHANNLDDDQDNDAYNVDFNFTLVVTPGEGDDLVVSIVNSDGIIIAKARLAGDGTNDDESFTGNLVNDGNGNYRFTGLTLIENCNQKFSLNLEGVQYLEEGVYLFKSANGEEYSQTYVTIAEGAKAVDLAVAIDFNFDVKEGTVTETRTWVKTGNEEFGNDGNTEEDYDTLEDEEETKNGVKTEYEEELKIEKSVLSSTSSLDGYIEIEEQEVPLANAPKTGSNTFMLFVISLLSGLGLAVTSFMNRKKENE